MILYFVKKGRYDGDVYSDNPMFSSVLTQDELSNIEAENGSVDRENLVEMVEYKELKNAKRIIEKLEGKLEEIGADMYVGYKKSCDCGEAANRTLELVENEKFMCGWQYHLKEK